MKITNKITVRINGNCVKAINSMNISYKSPAWKRDLLRIIQDEPNKLNFDMMVYLSHVKDPSERERQATSLCASLSKSKIPFKRVITLETYHNIGGFDTDEETVKTINRIK